MRLRITRVLFSIKTEDNQKCYRESKLEKSFLTDIFTYTKTIKDTIAKLLGYYTELQVGSNP